MEHVLEHGSDPVSVFVFCKKNKWKEEDFFANFNSFEALKSFFWENVFANTRDILEADKTYKGYGFAEKLSSFYFLWTQQLLSNRSYVLTFKSETFHSIPPTDKSLKGFRKAFIAYAHDLVKEGVANGEIADRKFITDKFSDAIWLQTLFLLNFWINDNSSEFESTDAAIEKSVALLSKMLGENILDQAFDFGKFLFQNMSAKG